MIWYIYIYVILIWKCPSAGDLQQTKSSPGHTLRMWDSDGFGIHFEQVWHPCSLWKSTKLTASDSSFHMLQSKNQHDPIIPPIQVSNSQHFLGQERPVAAWPTSLLLPWKKKGRVSWKLTGAVVTSCSIGNECRIWQVTTTNTWVGMLGLKLSRKMDFFSVPSWNHISAISACFSNPPTARNLQSPQRAASSFATDRTYALLGTARDMRDMNLRFVLCGPVVFQNPRCIFSDQVLDAQLVAGSPYYRRRELECMDSPNGFNWKSWFCLFQVQDGERQHN